METNYIEQIINSPENPYGRNAARIQRKASLQKMIAMQSASLSDLETSVDFSKYTAK